MSGRWPAHYFIPEPSAAEAFFRSAVAEIDLNLGRGDTALARRAALDWAEWVSDRLGLESVGVWKYFKRNLTEHYFGRVERRRFAPGWSVEDIFRYANRFRGTRVRMSFFTPQIACHAESVRIPVGTMRERREFIQLLDNRCAVEVFPESSGPGTISFRRFTTEFGEDVVYEAAHGQAMDAFETEQGHHAVAHAVRRTDGYHYTLDGPRSRTRSSITLSRDLAALLDRHDPVLGVQSFALCRMVGIEYLSIEGYFTRNLDRLVVVDIDLPLDSVLMRTE